MHLDSVSLKVSSSLSTASLVSAPGGVVNWTQVLGGINAGGCSGGGGGFDCAEATSVGVSPVVPGGIYSWVFNLTMPTGGLFTAPLAASVRARYVDDAGVKVDALVSEHITLTIVPEPSTLLLMGAGLAALALSGRRQA